MTANLYSSLDHELSPVLIYYTKTRQLGARGRIHTHRYRDAGGLSTGSTHVGRRAKVLQSRCRLNVRLALPILYTTLAHFVSYSLTILFLFDLATSLTKLSMLAMVRRLTAVTSNNKVENTIALVLAALITINCFTFIVIETFQCWYVPNSLRNIPPL
jgi:hypothetical protein